MSGGAALEIVAAAEACGKCQDSAQARSEGRAEVMAKIVAQLEPLENAKILSPPPPPCPHDIADTLERTQPRCQQ